MEDAMELDDLKIKKDIPLPAVFVNKFNHAARMMTNGDVIFFEDRKDALKL